MKVPVKVQVEVHVQVQVHTKEKLHVQVKFECVGQRANNCGETERECKSAGECEG